jgi:glycosyltransferase involved in cell wall biosynthesis
MLWAETPDVSIVMPTYNRGPLLSGAVQSVLAQRPAITPAFELIVVDNNSTDDTREIIERFARTDGRVRYVFEPQQGSSHGRNAGIREARAPLVAFIDDDVRAEPEWVAAIVRAFEQYPHANVVGGRVLPIWPVDPPAWLTRDHWSPLALVDYGDVPAAMDAEHPLCLVSANLSLRRHVFDVVGGFAPDLGLVKAGTLGSVEDHEFLLRVLRAGNTVFYDPRITVHADIQPNRLARAYHRRWHSGHGYFHARLRSEQMEETRVGTLFGVPAHMYRQAFTDVVGWLRAWARRESARAFHHESRLRFFYGFFRTRLRDVLEKPVHVRFDLRQRLRALVRRGPITQPAARGVAQGDE